MTVQEMDGRVATTLAWLSRLTVHGLSKITSYHLDTVRLLRRHKCGEIRILPKLQYRLDHLDRAIAVIAADPTMYLPEMSQQTFKWEEYIT